MSHSLDGALALAAVRGEKISVARAGQIYRQAMWRADRLLVTAVDLQPDGQVTFPEIHPDVWRETSRESVDEGGPSFAFVTYEHR